VQRPPRRLRIAFTAVSPLHTIVDPVASQAVRDAAQLLASLGHEVEEVTPPGWQMDDFIGIFLSAWGAGVASGVRWGASVTRRAPSPELVESLTWGFFQLGMTHSAPEYLEYVTQLQSIARGFVRFFTGYDALLLPALGTRPLAIGALNTMSDDWQAAFQVAITFSPFTAQWNLTGQPAISLPLFHGEDGLPLGVQIVGRPLGEDILLQLGAQLEAVRPWAQRIAPQP
jgi:amidase